MRKFFIFILLFLNGLAFAQEEEDYDEGDEDETEEVEEPKKKKPYSVHGYVKYMHTANYAVFTGLVTDQLIHNRLNFKWEKDKLQLKAGVRNRIFYGYQVDNNPLMQDQLEYDNGIVDMSYVWLEGDMLGSTIIDRLYGKYTAEKWEVSVGRQRINWGINLAWNTNDLFNTYNFTDFDYEERPGSDAVRVQYYLKGGMNVIDIAASQGDTTGQNIIAGRYQFNKKGYDIQFIGGKYYDDLALGLGWAGNIKMAGFKGEATYFNNVFSPLDTSINVFDASISFDYSFSSGAYFNISGLYNSAGIKSGNNINLANLGVFQNISAKNLMPTQWSGFVQGSYPISPLTNGGLSVIYGSGINMIFLMPTLSHSVRQDFDLTLVGQIYFAEFDNTFSNLGNSVFLRLKWSF